MFYKTSIFYPCVSQPPVAAVAYTASSAPELPPTLSALPTSSCFSLSLLDAGYPSLIIQ